MINPHETFLEKAWGESLEEIEITDVKKAIVEVQHMDDEHGAFWVGWDEYVLESNKDLSVIAVFEDTGTQIKVKAQNWTEIENLYRLLLYRKISELKDILNKMPSC